MSSTTRTDPARTVYTGRRRTVILAVVLPAAFMDLLGATIANIALPAIHTDLGASPAQTRPPS